MTTDPRLTIIENPRAGRGRHGDVLAGVRARLAETSADAEYIISTSAAHAERVAVEAARAGRTVFTCGGDGHVGRLAGVAARESIPFGVIRTGAGNDYATELGLSAAHLDTVSDTLLGGKIRHVDMGIVGEHLFCGVAGCGFSSEANEWANNQQWLNGTGLYIASVLRTLATYRPRPIHLTIDGEMIETAAWLVAIANARALGGGMRVAPDAEIGDGMLDIVIVGPVSRFEFLRTFPKVFKGAHVTHPQVAVYRGQSIDIEQPDRAAPLAIYADGERAGELPNRFEARANCLQQLIPEVENSPT